MHPKRGGARDDAHSARDDAISARDDARSARDDARSARDAAGDDGEPHAHHLMREVIRGHRRSSEVIRGHQMSRMRTTGPLPKLG
jgi:hypothetical protein